VSRVSDASAGFVKATVLLLKGIKEASKKAIKMVEKGAEFVSERK